MQYIAMAISIFSGILLFTLSKYYHITRKNHRSTLFCWWKYPFGRVQCSYAHFPHLHGVLKYFFLLVQYVHQTNKHTGISAEMLPYYLLFISHLHSIAIIQSTMFPVCALLLLFVVVVVEHYTWPCSTESHFCARSTSENCACHWRIYFYGTR